MALKTSTIKLKDGTRLRCEVEWDDDGGLWFTGATRITYFHGGTMISLEGARHIAKEANRTS